MCFVLELKEPAFCSFRRIFVDWVSVGISSVVKVNENRTGVDFRTYFNVIKLVVLAEVLCGDTCHIHESNRLVLASNIKVGAHSCVVFVRLLEEACVRTVGNLYFVKVCKECCMTAVVRPVCIKNTDFCDCRIAVDALEIVLKEFDVQQIHCKTEFLAV